MECHFLQWEEGALINGGHNDSHLRLNHGAELNTHSSLPPKKYNSHSCNISSSKRGLLLKYGVLTQLEGNGGTRDRLMAFFSERQ